MTELFASRATRLISAACRLAGGVVLLPALFCTEVAEAIEQDGLQYRCYDVPSDLSCCSAQIAGSIQRDVGSILTLHPFGLCRPFDIGASTPRVTVIEDACHALRTSILDSRIGRSGSLTVFSFRKEFNWAEGGLAMGLQAGPLRCLVRESPGVAARWRRTDALQLAQLGLLATRTAKQALGARLPALQDHEVLTAIPLKSRRRDWCIERLRREGIEAWRWRGLLKGVGPRSTPQTCALQRELFLVPLHLGSETDGVIRRIASMPLGDWEG